MMIFTYTKNVPEDQDVIRVDLHQGGQTWVELNEGQKTLKFGIGAKKLNLRKLSVLLRKLMMTARNHRFKRVAFNLESLKPKGLKITDYDLGRLIGTNFEMANFEFVVYKTPPKEGWNFINEVIFFGKSPAQQKKGIEHGSLVGQEVNSTRVLSNTPGGEMTPTKLAEAAQKAAEGTKIKVKILDRGEIKKLKMGGVLGVSQGSSEEPKFIIMEYFNGPKKEKPIVLVGKGVTFDTGGLNLKPDQAINDMHMDMSGGAAVIHALVAAAKLKLRRNVVALVPAVENMPSGASYRPGDVLKTMSGQTIEVLNTDAEGRIVMADALTYAKRYEPSLVVDATTLTGTATAALGQHASALFTKDEKLEKLFRKFGEESGDYVWPLPLWDEFENEVKGNFADWANIGKVKYGGAIHAAMFLYQWAKDYKWVHLDIAPRMVAAEGDQLAKGAAGAPVRLLVRMLEKI